MTSRVCQAILRLPKGAGAQVALAPRAGRRIYTLQLMSVNRWRVDWDVVVWIHIATANMFQTPILKVHIVGMSLFTYEEPNKRSQTRVRVWFDRPARQRREWGCSRTSKHLCHRSDIDCEYPGERERYRPTRNRNDARTPAGTARLRRSCSFYCEDTGRRSCVLLEGPAGERRTARARAGGIVRGHTGRRGSMDC